MEATELKACGACAKAKRKCGRQSPTCNRCLAREYDCVYPAPHQTGFVFYGMQQDLNHSANVDPLPTVAKMVTQEAPQAQVASPDLDATAFLGVDLDLWITPPNTTSFPNLQSDLQSDLHSAWFLTPESWFATPLKRENLAFVSKTEALGYVDQVHIWLADWVSRGSNPFIHSRLYQTQQPLCIQDAFTALSSYLSRTPATEDFVLSILGARADSLVAGMREALSPDDCYAHLGRVHALLVYSVIRLFGTDIRQRYLAEQQLPVLRTWSNEMLTAARRDAENGHLLVPNKIHGHFGKDIAIAVGSAAKQDQERFWHAWILSESIRRTWVVVQIIYSVYVTMQQGESECAGSVLTTTRRGVWDAPTALSWTKICGQENIGFLRRDDMEQVLVGSRPGEVDDFAKVLMKFGCGTERFEILPQHHFAQRQKQSRLVDYYLKHVMKTTRGPRSAASKLSWDVRVTRLVANGNTMVTDKTQLQKCGTVQS
ncbi:hypothetical protein B0J13DRAFT_532263 [Dactylonectria estremocensis]|uniref:Zn(2)-C6 fungal-type domain-containing protein n=1 Tax=Dactylonectria estremocensis TaxID=1079267 RepID=A0A9P9DGW6_9HYPO|nr:hypothetical protein B0J13DRAFT_532263 [Dactylonectria estremocensis]